ncbi:MAG: S-layer homology domain-containing protein [Candidatus Caenarcaniphilales bacterium]|nr:S-layer homology domain-containing protein [Candidatus Caenarcaniphilales bacterium]
MSKSKDKSINPFLSLKTFLVVALWAIQVLFLQLSSMAYTDVKQSDWSYDAINELTSKYGVLMGYPDGKFKPKKNITREEAAAELFQLIKWVENHPTSVAVDDLRRMNSLINEFQGELMQLQNEVRAIRQDTEIMKTRIEEIDARLDWNVKNRGLVHTVVMGTGKLLVGAGKDVITLGKGTVWLFTFGRVNLFNNPNKPPDPIDKTNRYNGPIQFLNGSAL